MIKEILSEGSGTEQSPYTLSLMRIVTLLSVVIAGAIAIIGIIKGNNLRDLATLCSVFMGFGVGGKVLQKRSEIKVEIEEAKRK